MAVIFTDGTMETIKATDQTNSDWLNVSKAMLMQSRRPKKILDWILNC